MNQDCLKSLTGNLNGKVNQTRSKETDKEGTQFWGERTAWGAWNKLKTKWDRALYLGTGCIGVWSGIKNFNNWRTEISRRGLNF
ncbi:MAG: hypothetical protein CM15mP109_15310 [Candidatus Dadabacteria bacterium]|nr:MAG: hypothetical protein CM15mP109_15310 [Candidatus Dadabacteria bacterium]